MGNAAENPYQWWAPSDHSPALEPGTILRAREDAPDDPYAVVRVVATHRVRDLEEAVITPALSFGENISAPISGAGGLLSVFDVLTEAEAAELLPEPQAAANTPEGVDVEASRRKLEQLRTAAEAA